jgi:hypothetical protein
MHLHPYLGLPIIHQVTPVLVPHRIQYISNSFKCARLHQFVSLLLQLTDLKQGIISQLSWQITKFSVTWGCVHIPLSLRSNVRNSAASISHPAEAATPRASKPSSSKAASKFWS